MSRISFNLTVQNLETVESVETVETVETVQTVKPKNLKKKKSVTHSLTRSLTQRSFYL